eukprot:TRINITY_DN12341_c0_g1_i1.p1 TRINITY_DN12341_c0_g1~~TRINITY_DN12341_c0_g1_i1.p1  ORF type:complete len:483 (+),score=71.70 TRINITY_DN12341_c0_g1_i1:53-1501(+)
MGNVCQRRRPQYKPISSERSDDYSLSARDRLINRCLLNHNGVDDVSAITLLEGFLQVASRDGYIDHDEHTELLDRVHDLVLRAEQGASPAQKLLEQDSNAALMLPSMGFANSKKWQSEKDRGDFDDSRFTPEPVSAGVDPEVILHDRGLDCRLRGDISEDAAIVAHAFSTPTNYFGRYRFDVGKFTCWVKAVAAQYTSASYHNWSHAFDVFQLSYLMLTDGGVSSYFNYQDACSILIAALAHDVGHTGTNNAFHVKTRTSLALMYNDRSPLENMHASLAFETMRNTSANFLDALNGEDYENVRSKIVDAILETDPSHHFEFVQKLDSRLQRTDMDPLLRHDEVTKDKDEQAMNKKDRRLLLQGFVHLADIGNAFRPWDVYKHLVDRLEGEFFAQGDVERDLGVPITPMMDRRVDSLASGQGFFLGKIVLPLYQLYGHVLEQTFFDSLKDQLEDNKTRWEALVAKEGKKPVHELLKLEAEVNT